MCSSDPFASAPVPMDGSATGRPKKARAFITRRSQEVRMSVVERNRSLPKVCGPLRKYAFVGPFGLFGEVSRVRWFELDPTLGTLSIWKPHERGGTPRRKLALERLAGVDTNPHHDLLFLKFEGLKKVIRAKAETHEDFLRWIEVLEHYWPSDLLGHRRFSSPRPSSSCSTDVPSSGASSRQSSFDCF